MLQVVQAASETAVQNVTANTCDKRMVILAIAQTLRESEGLAALQMILVANGELDAIASDVPEPLKRSRRGS